MRRVTNITSCATLCCFDVQSEHYYYYFFFAVVELFCFMTFQPTPLSGPSLGLSASPTATSWFGASRSGK